MSKELYQYVKLNRGVGHTQLLFDGARNANYPFLVVGADMSHAKYMVRELGNEFAIPISLTNPDSLKGYHHPIMIDNFVFTTTIEEYIKIIRDQREQIQKIEDELEAKRKTITNFPFWIRLFKPLYKREIRKLYEK